MTERTCIPDIEARLRLERKRAKAAERKKRVKGGATQGGRTTHAPAHARTRKDGEKGGSTHADGGGR